MKWWHYLSSCQQRALTARILKQFLVSMLGQFCLCCFSTWPLTRNELWTTCVRKYSWSYASHGSKLSSLLLSLQSLHRHWLHWRTGCNPIIKPGWLLGVKFWEDLWKQEESLFCFNKYSCEKYKLWDLDYSAEHILGNPSCFGFLGSFNFRSEWVCVD